jgi:hypothetical protein
LLTLCIIIHFTTGAPGAHIQRELENNGWLACVQEKGWFDGRVGQIWIEKVLAPYVRDAQKALLLVDHFSVHLTSEFVKSANNLGVDVDFVPAGYTCVLQPVDVGVNAPFKTAIRDLNHAWCLEQYPKIANKDKLPTPSRDNVYDWVVQAFETVSAKSIQKTFAHIGYIDKILVVDADDKQLVGDDDDDHEDETLDEGLDNEVDVDESELIIR